MKATVDKELCTGCGLCVNTAPDIFEMDEDVAVVKVNSIPDSAVEEVEEAADNCPVNAIEIED